MFISDILNKWYHGGNKIHEVFASSSMPLSYAKQIFINYDLQYFNGIQLIIKYSKRYNGKEEYWTTAGGQLPMDFFLKLIDFENKNLIVKNKETGYKYRLYNILLKYSTVTQSLSLRGSISWKPPHTKIWQRIASTQQTNN